MFLAKGFFLDLPIDQMICLGIIQDRFRALVNEYLVQVMKPSAGNEADSLRRAPTLQCFRQSRDLPSGKQDSHQYGADGYF